MMGRNAVFIRGVNLGRYAMGVSEWENGEVYI
jgi:hypothetical protein